MKALVQIADHTVQFNDDTLARLNAVLKDMPLVNRYDHDKLQENKRIKLQAKLVVDSTEYTIEPK